MAGAAMFLWSVTADVQVCPKCGYELPDTAENCSHCGAVTPTSETDAQEAGHPVVGDRSVNGEGLLTAETVDRELDMAREAMTKGHLELAEFFLRNGSALNQLAPSTLANERGEQILALLTRCRKGRGYVRVKCPACDGSKKSAPRDSLDTGGGVRLSVGGPCRSCAGKGYLDRTGRVNEWRLAMGQARKEYRLVQQNRRYQPVGEAWVPPDVADTLTFAQRVVLKRATVSSCSDCSGLGRVECEACNGIGRTKCSNRKCANGIVVSKRSDQFGKGKHPWRSKCPVCDGQGGVTCVECGGKGAVLCRECGGSGERKLCRRCSGEGLAPCRRCGGTRVYKGERCTSCRGEGAVECSACNGDGRAR